MTGACFVNTNKIATSMTKKPDTPADREPVVKALHVAFGFATFAILAIFLVKPVSGFFASEAGQQQIAEWIFPDKLDRMTTGSIAIQDTGESKTKRQNRLYTVRRSVLQKSHENACVIAKDGGRTGDC